MNGQLFYNVRYRPAVCSAFAFGHHIRPISAEYYDSIGRKKKDIKQYKPLLFRFIPPYYQSRYYMMLGKNIYCSPVFICAFQCFGAFGCLYAPSRPSTHSVFYKLANKNCCTMTYYKREYLILCEV